MPSSPDSTTQDHPLLDADLLRTLERLSLASQRRLPGRLAGDRKSPKKGAGVEFADFREYAPGDDLRRVDWNVYARAEKLFLKLYSLDEDRTVSILIDCSRSMAFGAPEKELYARRLAAALGYLGLVGMDRVKLYPLSSGAARPIGPLRGRQELRRLLDWLQTLTAEGAGGLQTSLQAFLASEKTPGVAIILSDFFEEGAEKALRGFGARDFDTTVIQVLSPEDVTPTIAGDLRLVDSESGETLDVTVSSRLLSSYKAALESLRMRVRDECLRSGLGFISVQTDKALMDFFARALMKSGVVA